MTAAERLDDDLKNRRLIFRMADPEFSKVKFTLKVQGQEIETTCLDLSATGVGVLAPEAAFEGASPGVILDYTLSFDGHSPIRGKALVANRLATTIESELGRLIRLGLRFADHREEKTQTLRQLGRRSKRYFLPKLLRPMCLCSDPLWLGDNVAIEIHDFSTHGLSGLVSAKKTVLTEGLRTVFRFGFANLGTYEVPVRIIYANPTEDPAVYRIGCEFVRRPKDFVQAIETYLSMTLMAPLERPKNDGRVATATGCRVLSSSHDIENARAELSERLGKPLSDKQDSESLYLSIENGTPSKTAKCFRLSNRNQQRQADATDEGAAPPTLTSTSALQLALAETQTFTQQEQLKALKSLIYLGTILKMDEISVLASSESETGSLGPETSLASLGLGSAQSDQGEHILLVQDIVAGRGISLRLWLASFFPMGRCFTMVAPLFQSAPFWRRTLLFVAQIFMRTHATRDAPDSRESDQPKRVL